MKRRRLKRMYANASIGLGQHHGDWCGVSDHEHPDEAEDEHSTHRRLESSDCAANYNVSGRCEA